MAISSSATGLRPGVCTSTTRPTAPYNGQLIYETDTRKVYIYNGTSWVEQPTAGMVDAKGDLLVGTAADTVARLAVGTNDNVLVADSAATNGVKWSALSGIGGAWTSYTPTLTQSVTVTKTVKYAKYIQIGKLVVVNVQMDITGSGTAGQDIKVGLPINASTSDTLRIGSGLIYDASITTSYTAIALLAVSNNTMWFVGDTSGGQVFGQAPNFGLANGDGVAFFVCYEAA